MGLSEQVKQVLEILSDDFPKHRLELIWKYKEVILKWLNSKEFATHYAKHPYPPLLNPEEIVWEETDPNLAWDLNLPLPPYYKMIFLCPHGVGHGAMLKFLRTSGGGAFYLSYSEAPGSAQEHYITHYQKLIQNKNKFNVLSIDSYGVEKFGSVKDREKYFSLISSKIPALMQVRDPIEIIKHTLTPFTEIIAEFSKLQRVFNLTFDYHHFNLVLQKRRPHKLPDFNTFKLQGYIYNSLVSALRPEHLTYMDMQEISKERAFTTLGNLASQFGFQSPKEEDKKVYAAKHFVGNLFFLWSNAPLELYVNAEDIPQRYSKKKRKHTYNPRIIPEKSFRIVLSNPYAVPGFIDIMGYFSTDLQKEVGVYIMANDFERLQSHTKLWQATKQYIQELLDFLSTESKKAQEARITTEGVLELLKKDKESLRLLKEVLEPELEHIKAHRPDIVESWRYYKEFVAMCKEFGI